MAFCALAAAATTTWSLQPARPVFVSNFKSQISNLDPQDRAASRILADLIQAERRLAVEDRLRQLESRSFDFRQQREETAVALLQPAADSPNSTDNFRQIAAEFPDTGAGIVARQQLSNQ
jgi:hypothetical protein